MSCCPPQEKFTVVSIFILRSYIEDDEFKKVLSQYGEIKRQEIRLKYKADLAFFPPFFLFWAQATCQGKLDRPYNRQPNKN